MYHCFYTYMIKMLDFLFNRPQAGCPRLVLATTCLLPESARIIITSHSYLLP